jgi:sec-independent protein translocase protein TatC
MVQDLYMSITEHLEDLRRCLVKSAAALVAASVVSYIFSDRIFAWMVEPLRQVLGPERNLIGTGVAEAFFTEIKVALVGGVFLGSPVLFHQVWRFISPGLREAEKKLVVPFVLCTSAFFVGGAYFCYWKVLPYAFDYFVQQYGDLGVSPEIRIGEYFTFFFRMIFAFGVTFELPILTFFLVRLGIWDHRLLWRNFRYAIIAVFILAAVLTPGGDVVSQLLLAVPLTVLYVLSIGIAYIWRKT